MKYAPNFQVYLKKLTLYKVTEQQVEDKFEIKNKKISL
jgi:hypothetical protein